MSISVGIAAVLLVVVVAAATAAIAVVAVLLLLQLVVSCRYHRPRCQFVSVLFFLPSQPQS